MTRGRGAAGRRDGGAEPSPGAARLVSDIEPMQVRGARKANARGDETRQLIIDEAARCILEEGFSGASANHVAQRSGVTWGVIQYHFGDRAGLLRAIVEAGFTEFYAHMDRVAPPEDGTVREQLAVIVDAGWEAFTTPICQAGIEVLINTRAERAHDPAPAADLLEMARGLHRVLVRTFPTPDHPDPRDPRDDRTDGAAGVLAPVVWAALRGFVLARMMSPNDHDYGAERDLLVELAAAHLERPAAPPPSPRPTRASAARTPAPRARKARTT